MSIIDILKAKAHLSQLVQQVESGATTEIIIARNGKPAARLVPIGVSARSGKRLGFLEGRYPTCSQAEFDATNEAVAHLFRGDA
jgi:prevent-host-death family protein